jgi:hypothetical protein
MRESKYEPVELTVEQLDLVAGGCCAPPPPPKCAPPPPSCGCGGLSIGIAVGVAVGIEL